VCRELPLRGVALRRPVLDGSSPEHRATARLWHAGLCEAPKHWRFGFGTPMFVQSSMRRCGGTTPARSGQQLSPPGGLCDGPGREDRMAGIRWQRHGCCRSQSCRPVLRSGRCQPRCNSPDAGDRIPAVSGSRRAGDSRPDRARAARTAPRRAAPMCTSGPSPWRGLLSTPG